MAGGGVGSGAEHVTLSVQTGGGGDGGDMGSSRGSGKREHRRTVITNTHSVYSFDSWGSRWLLRMMKVGGIHVPRDAGPRSVYHWWGYVMLLMMIYQFCVDMTYIVVYTRSAIAIISDTSLQLMPILSIVLIWRAQRLTSVNHQRLQERGELGAYDVDEIDAIEQQRLRWALAAYVLVGWSLNIFFLAIMWTMVVIVVATVSVETPILVLYLSSMFAVTCMALCFTACIVHFIVEVKTLHLRAASIRQFISANKTALNVEYRSLLLDDPLAVCAAADAPTSAFVSELMFRCRGLTATIRRHNSAYRHYFAMLTVLLVSPVVLWFVDVATGLHPDVTVIGFMYNFTIILLLMSTYFFAMWQPAVLNNDIAKLQAAVVDLPIRLDVRMNVHRNLCKSMAHAEYMGARPTYMWIKGALLFAVNLFLFALAANIDR